MDTATGQVQKYIGTGILGLPHLPADLPRTRHTMPSFKHILIDIGSICDADCKVVFAKQYVVVYDPQQQPFTTGCREPNGKKLWRIVLLPSFSNIYTPPTGTTRASLQAFSAYDLPRVDFLVRYFHAASGFPVRDTWLRAIKCGN